MFGVCFVRELPPAIRDVLAPRKVFRLTTKLQTPFKSKSLNWQCSWVSSMSALQWDYLVTEDQKLFLDSIVVWDRQYSCLGKGQQIPLGPLLE